MEGITDVRSANDEKFYVVRNTGEVIREITGDFVVAPSGALYANGTGRLSFYKPKFKRLRTGFIKLNEVAFAQLDKEMLYAVKLLPYIGYLSGKLSFDNNKPIRNYSSIARICNISMNNCKKMMKKLIDEDIIHKHGGGKTGYFTFNPFVALRGVKATMELYEEFEESKWRWFNTKE